MSESVDRLKYILDNVNQWLKFAESKNAALLVFNSALGFGIVRILSTTQNLNANINYCLKGCVLFIAVSACICLISFVPKILIPSLFTKNDIQSEGANLIFFAHITEHTPEAYRKALISEKIIDEEEIPQKFLADLCNQIVINSRIAVSKYIFFNCAIWLTVVPVVVSVILGLINFIL